MTFILLSRSFEFSVPYRRGSFQADADFVSFSKEGSCAYCGSTRNIRVLYCRADISYDDGSPCTNFAWVGKLFFKSIPHGILFCPRHTSAVKRAVDEAISAIRPDKRLLPAAA